MLMSGYSNNVTALQINIIKLPIDYP